MTTRHRPAARACSVNNLVRYRLRCSCGAAGPARQSRAEARRDVQAHIESLPPVPADQQCRDPKTHGVKAWEPCPLCADQLPLW